MEPSALNAPFAQLDDQHPFLRPNPGGRAPTMPMPVGTTHDAGSNADAALPDHGLNPLVALANKLLMAVPPLRATRHVDDPVALRHALAQGIREFAAQAADAGIPGERVMAARYVLCTVVDEAAADTPWAGSGEWARDSLLAVFHNETWGDEKIFQLMTRLAEKPEANLDLLELIYCALVLGFEGRYRVLDNGRAQIDAVRDRLAQIIKQQRGDHAPALAQRWQGEPARQRRFNSWLSLESERARRITIGTLDAIGFVWMLLARWRAQRGNQAVINQLIAAPKSTAGQTAEMPDMAAVRERFDNALLTLGRARFGAGGLRSGWSAKLGGRYLYELPWYLIIGAPGSGKTTALRHSGLNFPLADATGTQTAIRGVGGTRHCDWWFTDRAVLIDTAGRFTTQDSDREHDRATWSGFLGLLKRSRPRRPVNGVLVTVSVSDLLTRGPAERAQHAATVRQRVQELHEDLGLRFPIYLLVTKSDLLAGFMDYFATVDKDQRATPWGFTFPLQAGGEAALQGFGLEFDALRQRLTDGLIDRLQTERDAQRRARIYGFPMEFAGLRPALQAFVDTVFSPSPGEADPLLRGVYFISGTQEGTPIDRVLGAVARRYRLERAVIAPNQASGKSYFLNRLLDEVVFAESGLGGTNPRWRHRRTVLAAAGYAAVGVVTIGLAATWSTSDINNRRHVADVAARSGDVRELLQATLNRPTADILPIVPALNLDLPSASGSPSCMVAEGPWAPWCLLERMTIEPAGAPERIRATFDVDGRKAVFEITTSSVRNPFRLRELNEFACPAGL